MSIELTQMQPEQATLLANLWQYYQLESSAREQLDVDSAARFETPEDVFAKVLRSDGGNSAYLVRYDNAIAGFLILLAAQIEGANITEFADIYVLPKYRGRGIASQVVQTVVVRSSQPWLIAVFRDDPTALAFWRSAFKRLPFSSVREIVPPELPEFHEFVVQEGGA